LSFNDGRKNDETKQNNVSDFIETKHAGNLPQAALFV